MKIEASDLFAIRVFASKLEGYEAYVPEIVSRICELRKAGHGLQASNQHAYHSLRNFHLEEDVATSWLCSAFLGFARAALTPVIKGSVEWDVHITGCWAIAADKGGWLIPHNHFPSPWAGVLYLDTEHVLGQSALDSAGKLDLLCPIPLAEAFGLPPAATIVPRDGLAILFPGALQHLVHPHRSERTRYSVSFNLAIRQKRD